MNFGCAYQISSKSHLRGILILLFILVGSAWWYAAKTDYEHTFERTQKELQQTTFSLEERVKRTISATELILAHLAERIEEQGVEAYASSRQEWERFRAYTGALPDMGSLWLLDKTGDCLLGSPEFPIRKVNFSAREYFKPQRDQGILTYVGPVVKGRIVKKYSFTISRRINGRDGSFQGIVLAAIDTDDFTNFLRNISLGEDASVSVWRTDGTLILRQPMEDRFLEASYGHLRLFKLSLSEHPSDTFMSNDTVDGIKRLVSYKKMDGMPLIAVTTIPVQTIKQLWLGRVERYSLIAALALLALLILSWLVQKSVAREEQARLALEENQKELQKYNAKLQESNQALQDFASIASHDLQEPLRKVSTFGNMLHLSAAT
jgi:C4-dicarboxylate-specific signal transduction histidine kinase